jgi:thiol:disulfide interchange protein DsbD
LFGGWLSNPWVLGGIGLLLLAMALSMFGLYELTAPSALLTRLGGAAGASLFGTFLAGLLVGVFAAPCIGPPIIALLAYVGSKGDPVFGFWAFFVLSLGLGLPYLVLGMSTGLLTRLPRSGSWMDWVKHLFGVILLGVAAFYLCLAIAPSKLAYVVPAALLLGGLYLGFLEPTGRDRAGFRRFKWAVGVAGIVAAAFFAFSTRPPAVEWQPYSEATLAAARTAGKPVVLDFGADWCVPCHELDHNTFTDRAVAEGLAPFVRMKVDFTRTDAPETIALRDRYAIEGVPTIVFLGPDGQEVRAARIFGFVPPRQFLERVKVGRAATALAEVE